MPGAQACGPSTSMASPRPCMRSTVRRTAGHQRETHTCGYARPGRSSRPFKRSGTEMATFPDVHVADLQAAYRDWPGTQAEKTAVGALVLRVRIERAAARLPRTVIAAEPDISMIERRLYLSIGEPGLSPEAQLRRMRVVAGALEAYVAICEILHGR